MTRFVLLTALSLFPAATQISPLVGVWSGTLDAGGAKLRVVLRVGATPAGLVARLDSIDQGAMGLPVTSITLENSIVHVEMRNLLASYEGVLSKDNDEIRGEWRQSGGTLPLVFRRGETGPSRPQDPKKPYPYREEEVTIENPAGGVKLAATLTLPVGDGPFPAVVLLTGSGVQDRNETIMGHRPFLVLADHLTRSGIAVLRADDRGVGGSTGTLALSTYEDLAGDVLAEVVFLKTRKEIDPRRIGLAGHSEGASVGMIAAGRSADISFLILMAGPGVTGEQLMYEQSSTLARMPGGNERAAALNRKLQEMMFTVIKKETVRETAEKRLREAIKTFVASMTEEDRKAAPRLQAAAERQAPLLLTPGFRSLLLFDPIPALAKVKCPVLALYGELDSQVPPAQNQAPLEAALKAAGNRDFLVVRLPQLNHLFQTAKSGLVIEYSAIEETFAPAALNTISAWIGRRAKGAQ